MAQDVRYAYIPFSRKSDDSQRIVEGYVSSPAVDCDEQIVDQGWLRSELPSWLAQWGNIRAQHDPRRAVGKAQSVDLAAQPGPYLAARIVDDDAWKKVKAGVYNGFSVGIKAPRELTVMAREVKLVRDENLAASARSDKALSHLLRRLRPAASSSPTPGRLGQMTGKRPELIV